MVCATGASHVRVRASAFTSGTITLALRAGQAREVPSLYAGPAGSAAPPVSALVGGSDGANLRVQSSRRRDVPGYPRSKGATPLRAALVPAYRACTSANRQHGAPLSSPSCNPPIQSSSVLTVGTLDANGFTANSVSSARFDTIVGNPSNSVDDADVRVRVSMTDIRNNPSGTDYTGRVLLSVPLQITDRNNAAETTPCDSIWKMPTGTPWALAANRPMVTKPMCATDE